MLRLLLAASTSSGRQVSKDNLDWMIMIIMIMIIGLWPQLLLEIMIMIKAHLEIIAKMILINVTWNENVGAWLAPSACTTRYWGVIPRDWNLS